MWQTEQQIHRVERVIRERLARLPVGKHPALRWRAKQEGYRDYVFGAKAGPKVDVQNIFHELGHAAEFGAENFATRCVEGSFYFKNRWIEVLGQRYVEHRSAQPTIREIRAIGYQIHFMELAGCKMHRPLLASSIGSALQYMTDWWHVPGEGDAERKANIVLAIMDFSEKIQPQEATDRLEGWLDATTRRWKRQKIDPATLGGING